MVRQCDACGREEYMPYACKFCEGKYCAAHRLPENHECVGLGTYKERMRQEGRIMAPEPELMRPTVSRSARWSGGISKAWDRASGRMAMVFLGLMAATFLLQLLIVNLVGGGLHDLLFVMDRGFYLKPWVLLTSVFAHGGLNHLLLNGIVLFFFGPTVENLIGTKRFTALFLGAGALGGLGEVFLSLTLPSGVGVVGASAAIMGLLGCLTILAPKLTVLVFFVIPAPLWAITLVYAFIDMAGAFTMDNVAHIAHLSGLAVGLLYGRHLHNKGLRAYIRQPQQPSFRRFG